jgi:hypothetical protein
MTEANEEVQQFFPYPEWNKGQKGLGWDVIDGGTTGAHIAVGPKTKEMVVPLGGPCVLCGESHEHSIRLHEQAHVRFTLDRKGRTPALPKDVKDIYIQSVEDRRMDMCLRSVGIDPPPQLCRYEAPKWKGNLERLPDKLRVLWMVSTPKVDEKLCIKWLKEVCKNDPPNAGRMSADDVMDIVKRAWTMLEQQSGSATIYRQKGKQANGKPHPVFAVNFHSNWEFGNNLFVKPGYNNNWTSSTEYRPHLDRTIKAARWLQSLMEQLGLEDPPKGQQQQGEGEGEGAKGHDPETHYDPSVTKPEAEAEQANITPEQEEAAEKAAQETPAGELEEGKGEAAQSNPNAWGGADTGWCDYVVEEPVLRRNLPGRLITAYRPTDMGAIVGGMHRWFTDQKVFRNKQRWPGGVLIVDCSGSMSITYEQLRAICESTPGVYICLYGSSDGGRGDGKATLRVVAKDGKWADEHTLQYSGGGNGIDGPAIAFGAKAPVAGPRVWLADGFVNGSGTVTSDKLRKECALLVKRHNIIHVNPHFVPGCDDNHASHPKVTEAVIVALKTGKGGGRYWVSR